MNNLIHINRMQAAARVLRVASYAIAALPDDALDNEADDAIVSDIVQLIDQASDEMTKALRLLRAGDAA